jgi:hypothetical protein
MTYFHITHKILVPDPCTRYLNINTAFYNETCIILKYSHYHTYLHAIYNGSCWVFFRVENRKEA